jgi:Protein of unknown function (DUF3168)
MSPAWSLQQSIFAALVADAALTALLGTGRIFDDVPQGSPLPYVTFGQAAQRDWSTAGEDGTEHLITLHVWSAAGGKKQAHEILSALHAALHDRPLSLAGHHLVNLRHEHSEIRRDPDGQTVHGLARFRAVTEPA